MFLFELASGDIDKELEKVAGNISNAGTAQQPMGDPGAEGDMGMGMGGPQMGDMTGMPQQPGQFPANQPEVPGLGAGGPDPEEQEKLTKKVDSYVMAATRGMKYATEYEHRESSPTHPYRILQMDVDELSNLKNLLRTKLGMIDFEHEPDDTRSGAVYFQRMLAFVERAIKLKKQTGKPQRDANIGRTGDFKKREQSKNEKKKAK